MDRRIYLCVWTAIKRMSTSPDILARHRCVHVCKDQLLDPEGHVWTLKVEVELGQNDLALHCIWLDWPIHWIFKLIVTFFVLTQLGTRQSQLNFMSPLSINNMLIYLARAIWDWDLPEQRPLFALTIPDWCRWVLGPSAAVTCLVELPRSKWTW
jgi:hypothetical protein